MNQSYKNSLIKKTEAFVKARLEKEGTGHDWWHIVRIRNTAREICKTEKADKFIVDLTLLLHDVGDRKVVRKAEDDYSIAENFLNENEVPSDTVEKVMFIIKNMSFRKTLNTKDAAATKEFQVVQDADRLDAVGAIGIARMFAFGGSRACAIYDPTKKATKIEDGTYGKVESSSFHHFSEKLLLLKDLMNTKTARKIAAKRHAYMEKYMKQFLLEWEGKL